MMNFRLATATGAAIEQGSGRVQRLLRARGFMKKFVILFNHADQKAQAFFELQALTRARQASRVQWGFESDAGLC